MPCLRMQLAQPAAQFTPHFGVESAERLVEQKDARLDRERDALALAAGQIARGAARFFSKLLAADAASFVM